MQGERREVEQAGETEQRRVADDQRGVLQAATDDRAEQVRAERRRRVGGVREALREDDVGAEDRQERDRRRREQPAGSAGAAAAQEFGITHASASAAASRAYITGIEGVRNRLVVSTAASTASSTPMKTIALTTQVVPNSSAKPVTDLVSSSRNAAPRKNRSAYGRMRRNGPPTTRTDSRLTHRIIPSAYR